MNDESIDNTFDSNYLFSFVVNADFFGEDLMKDRAVVHENLLVQDRKETNALNSYEEVLFVDSCYCWSNQRFTNSNDILIIDVCQATLFQQSSTHDQSPFEAKLFL